ncbi:hypothetical protein TNCV_4048491 [Trichonephila clavipes]|nr:hypothetical protein TNCV_4048491 [Trichonephila clavipes]
MADFSVMEFGRPRATADREDVLIVGSAVAADESRFQLCLDDHRGRVWRSPGQRADPTFNIARYTVPQPGVGVLRAISFDSRTSLFILRAHLQNSGTSAIF